LIKRSAQHAPQWRVHRRTVHSELLVVVRLDEANKAIHDYLLVPAPESARPYLTLSEAALARHKAVRVESMDELIGEIKAKLMASSNAASAKPRPQNKQRNHARPRRATRGANRSG